MKIKLRDMTEEQFKKWRRENCFASKLKCENCLFEKVPCNGAFSTCWVCNKDLYSEKFLNQEIEIEDAPILTEKEKTYLEAVLKPFKERIKWIRKEDYYTNKELLNICINNECLIFPYFEAGTMYTGMQVNIEYTLEELGLFKEEK